MKIYNTLSHSIEEFVPNEPGKVKMYTCGPTVYHFAHIGNLRSYIMEDVLEKYLRYSGYDVLRCMWDICQATPTQVKTKCSRGRGASTKPSWRLRNSTPTHSSAIAESST